MTNKCLLIHVGYHKTGTTWLQKVGFRRAHGFHQVLSHNEVFEKIVHPHKLLFSEESAKELILGRLEGLEGDVTPVISSEILCGNPFYGGRESCEYCDRLLKVVPTAKILFTIREQHKALVSTYMQYLSRGGTETPNSFFLSKPSVGYFTFSVDHFKYDRLIGYYQERFGSENIMVATQEELIKNSLDVIERALRFSGNDFKINQLSGPSSVGVSFPEITSPILRRLNYLRFRPSGRSAIVDLGRVGDLLYEGIGVTGYKFSKFMTPPRIVYKFVKKNFSGEFAESNQKLLARLNYGICLEGYEL